MCLEKSTLSCLPKQWKKEKGGSPVPIMLQLLPAAFALVRTKRKGLEIFQAIALHYMKVTRVHYDPLFLTER